MYEEINTIYGYGICVSNNIAKISDYKVDVAMCYYFEDYWDKYVDMGGYEDLIEAMDDFLKDEAVENDKFKGGWGTILIDRVFERFGVRLSAYQDANGESYLIFDENLPWLMNDKEKSLTEDELRHIMKYALNLIYEDTFVDEVEIKYYILDVRVPFE